MASDLQQKLDDVIKLQLESKADIEALGRKAVWMADRIMELEAALRQVSNLASEARRSVEGGFHRTAVVMAQSIKDVAQTALERKE